MKAEQEAIKRGIVREKTEREGYRMQRRQEAIRFEGESGLEILLHNFYEVTGTREELLHGCMPRDIHSTEDDSSVIRFIQLRNSDRDRAMAVEICPDGTIVFWGGQRKVKEIQAEQKPKNFIDKIMCLFTENPSRLTHTEEFLSPTPVRSVPELNWRNNPNLLEEGLVEAYRKPFYCHIIGYDEVENHGGQISGGFTG